MSSWVSGSTIGKVMRKKKVQWTLWRDKIRHTRNDKVVRANIEAQSGSERFQVKDLE